MLFSASVRELDGSNGSPEDPIHITIYALPFRAGDAQFYGGRQPSVCRDAGGRLWFPSSRGVIYVVPGEVASTQPSAVFFRSVVVDGQALANPGAVPRFRLTPVGSFSITRRYC